VLAEAGTTLSGVKGLRLHNMRKEWLYAMLALGAGLIGGIIGGRFSNPGAALAAEAPVKNIAAEEIALVDAHNKTHAFLHLNKDGDPSFELYDHLGKLRAGLGFSSGQELGLKLFDAKGATRIIMTVSSDGVSALRLLDSKSQPRELLGIDNAGEPAIDFYSSDGRLLRELP
jgi:hypothetical protein